MGGWVVMLWFPLPCPCNLPPQRLTPCSVSPLVTPHPLIKKKKKVKFWPPLISPCFPPSPFPRPPEPDVVFTSSLIYRGRALQVEEKDEKKVDIYVLLYKSMKRILENYKVKVKVLLWNAEMMHLMDLRGGMYRKPVNIVYFEFENMEI